MKKSIATTISLMVTFTSCAQDITLPAPDFAQKSLSMIETLQTRHSVRSFADTPLDEQQLSNLCWAACGPSRDDQHITAPTAMNKQEILLFVFTAEGVYEYAPQENVLQKKADGDHRDLVAGSQEFAKDAPVSLVMVIDYNKLGMEGDRARLLGCVDAGNVSENINLYCQSVGLATVPRATMDNAGISKLLGLNEKQVPVMNNPVGFEKK